MHGKGSLSLCIYMHLEWEGKVMREAPPQKEDWEMNEKDCFDWLKFVTTNTCIT